MNAQLRVRDQTFTVTLDINSVNITLPCPNGGNLTTTWAKETVCVDERCRENEWVGCAEHVGTLGCMHWTPFTLRPQTQVEWRASQTITHVPHDGEFRIRLSHVNGLPIDVSIAAIQTTITRVVVPTRVFQTLPNRTLCDVTTEDGTTLELDPCVRDVLDGGNDTFILGTSFIDAFPKITFTDSYIGFGDVPSGPTHSIMIPILVVAYVWCIIAWMRIIYHQERHGNTYSSIAVV